VIPRLPLYLRFLAVICLLAGLWGAMTSLAEVNGALFLERNAFVWRVRDRQLVLFDQLQAQAQKQQGSDVLRPFVAPFLKLPRAEADRLSLLLGDVLYDRRGVAVPLAALELILCWLLISGSLAALRQKAWGLSTWSFACWASIFFCLLSMLVTFVHSRMLMDRLGQPVSVALAQATGHSPELELAGLWQLTRLYVLMRAALSALWALVLGVSALLLQRRISAVAALEKARKRSHR
jgi:hypothetical protein